MGRNAEATQVRDSLAAWLRGLNLPVKVGQLADPPGPAASLVAESAAAASALAGLAEEHGNVFGSRRVVVLYTDDLASRPPAGELSGDTVVVITRSLPSVAAASAAQVNLLAAGAAQAAVVGPEVTGPQLAALVSADLGQGGIHESASAPVLFANDSAALSPSAVAQLTALLPQLREAGVTAVINGFASTPGTALANYTLSYDRAAMVASFFESHGITGVRADHRGTRRQRPYRRGQFGRQPPGDCRHRAAVLMSLAQDLGEVHRPGHRHPGDQHGCGPPVVAGCLPVETTPLPGDPAERRPVCWGRPWCDPLGRTLRTLRGIRPPQRPLDSVRLGAANRSFGIVDDLDPCLPGTARWEELRQKPRASYLKFRFSQHAPLRRARRVDEPNVPAACSLTVSAWCQRCLHDHDIAAGVTVNAQVRVRR